MVILLIILAGWVLYPFFGIPFAIGVKSENNRLKKIIQNLEAENFRLRRNRLQTPPEACINNSAAQFTNLGPEADVSPESGFAAEAVRNSFVPAETFTATDKEPENSFVCNEAPVPEVTERAAESGKTRNVSGLLVSGVSMVLLAGLIFVTTNWSLIGTGVKIFLMILATAIFFGASAFAEKKLSIHSTSKGFFILGTMFIPITCIAFFFFEMLGPWISFSGEGRWLALMAVFLSCSASCILITNKYQIRFFAFMSMMFISAAVGSFGMFSGMYAAMAVIAAGYSVLLLVLNEDTLTKLHVPFVYTDVYRLYSRISAFSFAFILMIYSAADGSTAEAAVAVLFILAVTLFIQVKTLNLTYEMICRIASAAEYLILAGLVTSSAYDADIITSAFGVHLMYTLLCVPAYAAYAFIPRIKSEVSAYILISALFVFSMSCFSTGHPLGCLLVLAMLLTNAADRKKISNMIASVLSLPLLWQFLTLCNMETKTIAVVVSVIVSALFITCVFVSRRFGELNTTAVVFGIFTAFIPFFTSIIYLNPAVSVLEAASFAAAAYEYARTDRKSLNILSVIAAVTDFQFLVLILSLRFLFNENIGKENYLPAYITGFVVMALLLAAGSALRKLNEDDGRVTAYLSGLMPLIMIVLFNPSFDGVWPFIFKMAYIAYCAVCGFISSGSVKKVFWSSGTVLLAFAAATQPFFEVSDFIVPEYYIFCSYIPYFFLFRIWKEDRAMVDTVMFVHTATAILLLSGVAISGNELFHALVIGIACVAVLIITAFTKDRKWRIMADTTLILLTLYMTRDFWASLAWWVYLLTAGVLLIGYAAFNEYCRKTGTENMIKNEFDNMIQAVKNKTDK